jgi:geranylgeranyl diphosphate synthase type I
VPRVVTETAATSTRPQAAISGEAADPAALFATYATRVKGPLDLALGRYLDGVLASVGHLPADVRATVDTVRDLTLRGGKRLRAVLMAAAYEACGGDGPDTVVMAGVSLELLQAYLLIHDDWMDADDVRRGGPSVPAMVRRHFASHGEVGRTADAFTILAGDFAAALALDALGQVPVSAGRVAAAMREMGRIQRDVVLGQMCDLAGELSLEPPTESAVELTHTLKTGSYTVRGPLALGASLAGADAALLRALEAFADPLGVAFQLRDDVLGTFGDPRHTGKPATGDLRLGKRTGLIAALAADGSATTRELLARGFGKVDASTEDIEALAEHIVTSGAKRRVDDRIEALLEQSMAALAAAPVSLRARELLRGAAYTLGRREK